MNSDTINSSLERILAQYGESFPLKVFGEESAEEDDLMLVFGLSQSVKAGASGDVEHCNLPQLLAPCNAGEKQK